LSAWHLAGAVALLLPAAAIAHDREALPNVFTGCLGPGGAVRSVQRGEEPKRRCSRRSEEIRLAEVPPGVTAVSWDARLQLGEGLSPAPGIQIECFGFGDPAEETNLTITINGEIVVDIFTESLGRLHSFTFNDEGSRAASPPFLVRAAGLAATGSPEEEIPCFAAGFAETFDFPAAQARGAEASAVEAATTMSGN
jgi:hypothetical protein